MTKFIVGVDPGKTGAIAVLTLDGTLVWLEDMTDLTGHGIGSWLAEIFEGEAIDTVFVEKVGYMPGQRGTWTFAEGYGAILGALGALGHRVELVTPSKWKGDLKLSKDKTASRQRAAERWPDHADKFRRVKDDGRAEACLIAEWGRTR